MRTSNTVNLNKEEIIDKELSDMQIAAGIYFDNEVFNITINTCTKCKISFPKLTLTVRGCDKRKKVNKFSLENNMDSGI